MPVLTGNSFTKITMKINGQGAQYAYGWSETYHFPTIAGADTIRTKGAALAAYRARFLCLDHSIDQVIASQKGAKGQTIKCNAAPVLSTALTTAQQATAAAANITITGTSNVTIGGINQPLGQTTALTEWRVGHPQSVLTFRVEGENFKRQIRQFHGIPDFIINDAARRNLPDGWTWFTTGVPTVPATSAASDGNYFQNIKDFFNYLILEGVMVGKHAPEAGESTPPLYDLLKPTAFLLQGVTNRKVGGAFGEPRGRAAIAS